MKLSNYTTKCLDFDEQF